MEELISEALHETVGRPLIFGVELVQFGVLVLLVKWVAVRFRKKPGVVVNMLAERRERIGVQLRQAAESEAYLANATERSETALGDARKEAERLVAEAREAAQHEVATVVMAAHEEAERMKAHTKETLDNELEEMLGDVRDQLVELVTRATRQILNEGLSPAEQRVLIQKSILAGVEPPAGAAAEVSP
ncbi:MAG: ATP synthase F0 subunit B [Coriobacteriia bacterium]|nr:ATP synthase F0 subunit B [Coriobacteriia bacterium]